MYARIAFLLVAITFGLVLAACGGSTATPGTARVGSRVQTQGGAYTNVTPQELQQLLANKNFSLINVHIPYEGEIDKTDAFIPYNEIDQKLNQLPGDKNAMLVLYCRSGRMSQPAAETLVKLGYTNVWNLDGGMAAWEQQGLPILNKNR